MKLSVQRFVGITALLFILTLRVLPFFSGPTLAQEPSPFEISLTPQADYAVRGQPFTYTVAITNVSQTPLKDIIVKTKTPEGTVLVNTYFTNPNWLVGGVERGEAGEIIWLTQQPVTPGEVITFELVVNVSSEFAAQQLINKDYVVTTITNNQPIASGPPLTTQVLTPTPLPPPTVQIADTPIPTITAPAIPPAQTSSELADSMPTPPASFTPAAQANPAIVGTATAVSTAMAQNNTLDTSSSAINTLTIIGLSGLILLIIGLVWFWKHR